MNIQIASIENGYIVASQPTQESIQEAQRTGQQPQPTTHYCEDYESLCQYLKRFCNNFGAKR